MIATIRILIVLVGLVIMSGCIVGTANISGITPVYPNPNQATVLIENSPIFKWDGAANASYDLCVHEAVFGDEDMNHRGACILLANGITGTEYQLPFELRRGVLYQWSIKPSNTDTWSHSRANMMVFLPDRSAGLKVKTDGFFFYVAKQGEAVPLTFKSRSLYFDEKYGRK